MIILVCILIFSFLFVRIAKVSDGNEFAGIALGVFIGSLLGLAIIYI